MWYILENCSKMQAEVCYHPGKISSPYGQFFLLLYLLVWKTFGIFFLKLFWHFFRLEKMNNLFRNFSLALLQLLLILSLTRYIHFMNLYVVVLLVIVLGTLILLLWCLWINPFYRLGTWFKQNLILRIEMITCRGWCTSRTRFIYVWI